MPAKLLVVMGKGGVGKTTLSAALALAHAKAGERVGLASLTRGEELKAKVKSGWGEPPATLRFIEVDPRAIVDGVVRALVPLAPLAHMLTSHPAYEAVYRIAPGIKETAVLHHLLRRTEEGGPDGALDLLVVDGLATGHGTHFLEAPRKGAHLLAGRLAERAKEIDRALTNPLRCSVVLATTLEEMPVRETLELEAQLRAGGFPLDGILANRMLPRLFPQPDALAALARLEQRSAASAVGSEIGAPWSLVRRMVRASAHLESRAREMEGLLGQLQGLGLPVVRIPFVATEDGRLSLAASCIREARL